MTVDNKVFSSEQAIDSAGTLQAFAECAEAVAATTKKLEKAALLGSYFETLSDPDLTRVLSPAELEKAFDLNDQLRNVDAIFDRVFAAVPA